jgi:hypothetical protein
MSDHQTYRAGVEGFRLVFATTTRHDIDHYNLRTFFLDHHDVGTNEADATRHYDSFAFGMHSRTQLAHYQ